MSETPLKHYVKILGRSPKGKDTFKVLEVKSRNINDLITAENVGDFQRAHGLYFYDAHLRKFGDMELPGSPINQTGLFLIVNSAEDIYSMAEAGKQPSAIKKASQNSSAIGAVNTRTGMVSPLLPSSVVLRIAQEEGGVMLKEVWTNPVSERVPSQLILQAQLDKLRQHEKNMVQLCSRGEQQTRKP